MKKLVRKTELNQSSKSLEIMKYKSFRITKNPTQKYPEMVTITKSKSTLKKLVGRSFTNLERVKIFIENELSKETIIRGKFSVEGQLRTIGLGYSYC